MFLQIFNRMMNPIKFLKVGLGFLNLIHVLVTF